MDEVIGADAEKPGFAGEVVGGQDGARDLDHDPHLDEGMERHTARGQLGLALLQDHVRLAEFVNARDHRIHDLHISECRRTEDRAELRFENFRVLQAEPDRPAAEERVLFLREVKAPGGFVAADVQGPDDDAVGF